MKIIVTVPVKRYVKRFLENNYGNPVNFTYHPRENEMIRRMLKKPCSERNACYKSIELKKYKHTVDIEVSGRDFYRHGWEITKSDTIQFSKHFEKHVKWLMRSVVGTYVSFGKPLHVAIQMFQKKFRMEEDYWSFESIKKEFYRFSVENQIDFPDYAYHHLEKFILVNMSKTGAVTKDFLQNHQESKTESQ